MSKCSFVCLVFILLHVLNASRMCGFPSDINLADFSVTIASSVFSDSSPLLRLEFPSHTGHTFSSLWSSTFEDSVEMSSSTKPLSSVRPSQLGSPSKSFFVA